MTEAEKEKKYIENLLNSVSINETIDTFIKIDEKIIRLLECSSEDFLLLNNEFKDYFKDYKHINQTASKLHETITKSLDENALATLKSTFSAINVDILNFFAIKDEYSSSYAHYLQKLESDYIHLTNAKQNLTSLKLILANIRIRDAQSPNAKEIDKSMNDVEQLVHTLKNSFTKLETIHLKVKDSFIESKPVQNLNVTEEVMSMLENIQEYIDLATEISVNVPSITKRIKDFSSICTNRIEKIITNLQYSDIIRQKIEHIQRTHKDILSELNKVLALSDNTGLIHFRVKVFFKIRDVAGLQAAQLLHANLQYQSAIVEINEDLDNIGNEMLAISKQSNSLFSTHHKPFNLSGFIDSINTLSTVLTKFNPSSGQISKNQIDNIEEFNKELKSTLDQVNDLVVFTTNLESSCKKGQYNASDLINISNIANLTKDISLVLIKLTLNPSNILPEKVDLSIPIDNLNAISENLKNIDQIIQPLLIEENNLKTGITPQLKDSVKRVKYYQQFEEVCENIIDQLNHLNIKLNYGRETESPITREENLKLLKSRYTMESEHAIHDHIAQKEGDINKADNSILEILSQKSNDEDDNLELF